MALQSTEQLPARSSCCGWKAAEQPRALVAAAVCSGFSRLFSSLLLTLIQKRRARRGSEPGGLPGGSLRLVAKPASATSAGTAPPSAQLRVTHGEVEFSLVPVAMTEATSKPGAGAATPVPPSSPIAVHASAPPRCNGAGTLPPRQGLPEAHGWTTAAWCRPPEAQSCFPGTRRELSTTWGRATHRHGFPTLHLLRHGVVLQERCNHGTSTPSLAPSQSRT